ncbi:MAG TPA: ABC transporter substrate-binding protein [Solirubrobacteraceae bacterium]
MYKKLCAAFIAALTVLAVAVCGSAVASTKKSAKKSPILIGVVTPGAGSPVVNSQASVSAVAAFIRDANASGGFKGHPLKLDYCNDKNDPNLTTTCSQKMVQDKVVMLAGGSDLNGPQLTTAMNKAGIPEVGQTVYDSTSLNSPNQFIMTSTLPGYLVVDGYLAFHHIKVAMLGADNSAAAQLYPLIQSQTKGLNNPWISQTLVPATVPDISPYVQSALKGGPGAIQSFLGQQQDEQVVQALGSMGSNVKWVTAAGLQSAAAVKALGETKDIQNVISFGNVLPLQDTSNPLIATFISQLKAYHKATHDQYATLVQQSSLGMQGWMALWMLQKFVNSGALNANHITAKTVMHAFQNAKNIKTEGVMPPWTPNAPGPTGQTRISMPYYQIWTFTDGGAKVKLLLKKPITAAQALAEKF